MGAYIRVHRWVWNGHMAGAGPQVVLQVLQPGFGAKSSRFLLAFELLRFPGDFDTRIKRAG